MTTTLDQPSIKKSKAATVEPFNRALARVYTLNWEAIAYLVIFALALFTRFYDLGARVMSHDESLHVRYSYNLYNEGNFQHTPLMHGPIIFHMTALNYFLFGDNDFTARIYTAVLGVLMVMTPLLFRRWLGRTGALVASVLLLISPLIMYYNRYIREDTPSIFFTLLMVYCLLMYVNGPLHLRRRARWLYGFSAAMLLSLGSKESGFIYIGIFGSFLTLYWLARMAQHFFKAPGRTVMNTLTVGILTGGMAALGMYVVLSIIRPDTIIPGSLEGAMFVNWTGLLILFVVGSVLGSAFWAYRGSPARIQARDVVILLLLAVIVCGVFIILEEVSWVQESAAETAEPADPNADGAVARGVVNDLPIYISWVVAAVVILGVLASRALGWWRTLYRFPELDILIVMGTLVLPWVTPLVIYITRASPTDYSPSGIQRAIIALIPMAAISITVGLVWNWKRWLVCAAIFYALFAFFFTTMFTNVNGLATGVIGSLGYWLEQQGVRRGNQPQYYYLLIILPFYEFLPIVGSVLAMLAGLTAFWRQRRERQEEELSAEMAYDGAYTPSASTGEPDELPSLAAMMGSEESDARDKKKRTLHRRDRLTRISFPLLVSWWAILNLIAYTLAGEKMPWLGTHMTAPLILLTAWYFGRVFDNVEWHKFLRGGWLYLVLLPLLFIALFQMFEPLLTGRLSFTNLQQQNLATLYEWLARVAVAGIVLVVIYQWVERAGWRQLRSMVGVATFLGLGLLTFRSAWMFSFINYDLPTEFGVYAHSAPAVKWVLEELQELSQRTTGGNTMRFIYDNETSWPNSWYYRDFPNGVFVGSNFTPQSINDAVAVVVGEANRSKVEPLLEDRYYHFEYIRMWWPMQDYFNLTAQRVANTFDFNPENAQAGQIRRGLFDIWWSRDYRTYSEATGGNWNLVSWPVSDRMHFYVRKDIAAQIWNLGVGEGTVLNPLEDIQVNVCTANWQPLSADLVFDTQQPGAALNHPIDLALGDDNRLFVADEFNNRVAVFNAQTGTYSTAIGQNTDGAGASMFTRPNGVAIGPDGNLYVADTWNYQIQVLTQGGSPLRRWGQPGQFGFEAQPSPEDGFWGPRDVAVDAQGNVYVSDTGNKRIRVYTADGQFVRDIGEGGSQAGQLDEPSGLAIHPDGRLFVADTWNRRISVFNLQGQPLYQFDVRGWYDDLGNRPYLAVDAARNLLYVTDPDAARVLVFDTQGNCVGSFGQSGEDLPDASRLQTVTGIMTDDAGNVYVSDAGRGRILRFAPFPAPAQPQTGGGAGQPNAEATSEVEVSDESGLDADAFSGMLEQVEVIELTPEVEITDLPASGDGATDEVGTVG